MAKSYGVTAKTSAESELRGRLHWRTAVIVDRHVNDRRRRTDDGPFWRQATRLAHRRVAAGEVVTALMASLEAHQYGSRIQPAQRLQIREHLERLTATAAVKVGLLRTLIAHEEEGFTATAQELHRDLDALNESAQKRQATRSGVAVRLHGIGDAPKTVAQAPRTGPVSRAPAAAAVAPALARPDIHPATPQRAWSKEAQNAYDHYQRVFAGQGRDFQPNWDKALTKLIERLDGSEESRRILSPESKDGQLVYKERMTNSVKDVLKHVRAGKLSAEYCAHYALVEKIGSPSGPSVTLQSLRGQG